MFIPIYLDYCVNNLFNCTFQETCNDTLKVKRSTLKEFLASAEPPDFSSSEAREQFAANSLLHLGL